MKFSFASFAVLATAAVGVMGKLDYSARSSSNTDLADWAIDRLNDLGAVRTTAQLGPVMDAFFSQNITIVASDGIISRADFLTLLADSLPNLTGSKLQLYGKLSVPDDPQHPTKSGWAALFSTYTSYYSSGNDTLETDSDHFLIEQDPTVHTGDARRVTYLHHIATIVPFKGPKHA